MINSIKSMISKIIIEIVLIFKYKISIFKPISNNPKKNLEKSSDYKNKKNMSNQLIRNKKESLLSLLEDSIFN